MTNTADRKKKFYELFRLHKVSVFDLENFMNEWFESRSTKSIRNYLGLDRTAPWNAFTIPEYSFYMDTLKMILEKDALRTLEEVREEVAALYENKEEEPVS